MSSEELAPWLQEIGRRPMPHNAGRPVPPIPHGLKRDKELDARAAGKLEQDFRFVIETCNEADEPQVRGQILDAMTGNRLASDQAYRLLSAMLRRFDKCQGISRIDADGNPQPLNRWGAA